MVKNDNKSNNNFMLSTKDNPYSPFTQFDEWRNFDENVMRYFSMNYLARLIDMDSNLTEEQLEEEVSNAMKHIVSTDPTGLYILVYN